MRAMRGNALETVPIQPYFGCTESFLKVLSEQYFQATRAMRAKTGCNRTLATVLWVPLRSVFVKIFGEIWISI